MITDVGKLAAPPLHSPASLKCKATWCLAIAVLALVAGCGPSLESKDPRERILAVKELTDQAVLAKVAIEDMDADVRRAAVSKLTDQAVLAKVAIEDMDAHVRREAIRMLTDQAVLGKVAIEGKDADVRYPAIRMLTDQAVLAKVAIEGKDANVRCDAVKNLTDQAVLAKLAIEDKNWAVRRAAVEKLTDQAVLAKLAIEDKKENVRRAAYYKLNDAGTLGQLSPTAADPAMRLYASILLKVRSACQPVPEQHRNRLCWEVSDIVTALMDPLVTTELGEVKAIRTEWKACSQKYVFTLPSGAPTKVPAPDIKGEQFTVSVTLSKTDQVVSRCWNTSFPFNVRGNDSNGSWRSANVDSEDFLGGICDLLSGPTLGKVTIESKRPSLRRAAVKKLTDQAVLAKVAIEDEDANVRRAAVEKLTDQAVLAKVAVEDKDWVARSAAVKNLTDKAVLAKLTSQDESGAIRDQASARLSELKGI
jgi:hypothetical protein